MKGKSMDEENKKEPQSMKEAWEILDKQQALQESTLAKVTHETLAEAMQAHLYLIEQAAIISKKFNKFNIHIKIEDADEEGSAYYSTLARIGREAAEELLSALIPDMKELQPYLQKELKKPQYEGKSIYTLYATAEQDPENEALPAPDSLFMKAMEAARMAAGKHQTQLPQLRSSGTPTYFISPNSTLVNALRAIDGQGEIIGARDGDGEPDTFEVPVMNKNKENEIRILVQAEIDEGVEIEGKPWTEYDRAVHDAVCSLTHDRQAKGEPVIATADMIYKIMTHKGHKDKVNEQQRKAVIQSIEKQGSINAKVDYSKEAEARKLEVNGNPVEGFYIEDKILHYKKVHVKAGGKTITAYQFDEPILYTYTKINNQFITMKGELLDVKEVATIEGKKHILTTSVSNNDARIAAKNYIIRRIKIMQNDEQAAKDKYNKEVKRCLADNKKGMKKEPKPLKHFRKQERVILFDTLFEAAGIEGKNRKTEIKEYTFLVLDYLEARGEVKKWSKRKRGKAVDAVLVEV